MEEPVIVFFSFHPLWENNNFSIDVETNIDIIISQLKIALSFKCF